MPMTCCVRGCRNRASKKDNIQYFSFPFKDERRLMAWINAINRPQWTPTKNSRICSQHFTRNDYLDRPGGYVKHLKYNAVPSVFMSSYELQQKELEEKETQDINKENVDPNMDIDQTIERDNIQINISNTDCSYTEYSEENVASPGPSYLVFPPEEFSDNNNIDSDDSLDDNTGSSHKELKLRYKVRILQQQVRRKNKKIDSLKQLLTDLKAQGKIEDDVMHLVSNEFDGVPFEIFKNQLLNCKETSSKAYRYTDAVKQFALTLHFYSPKAYQYCRNIGLCLPNPSSLRNWTMSVNAEPGFQRDVFSALKQLNDEDRDCNLVFDSMAIRKQVMWDKQCQKYIGYCNYGNELHLEGSDTVATEALVFMLVGINGKWKWPIGYFFIDKIKAVIQAELIKTALILAGDAGIRVCSITCDGAVTNIRTLEILGCNIYANSFTDIKNYFIHPTQGYNVYVILDPCHMLKLARNTLGDKKLLKSDTGLIQWNFIEKLYNLQQKLTLKFKNKCNSSCIRWQQNEMKVKYAAQTLSASVANAIMFLQEEGIEEFKNCEATVEFINIIDQLFDFLNSRNPFGKGYKKPIFANNLPKINSFIENKINYLFNLKDANDNNMYKSGRKTFIYGFALAVKSILQISEKLFKDNNSYKYILTYKFSQDHIETLFSRIRSRHGFNNNPNVTQFRVAMKQILIKNAISTSSAANCTALDTDCIGSLFEYKWTRRANKLIENSDTYHTDINSDYLHDMSAPLDSNINNELKNNILYYIAGYIVTKLLKLLKCVSCANSLIQVTTEHNYCHQSIYSKLLQFNNNGGLTTPSLSVYTIVAETEKQILICTNNLNNLTAHDLGKTIILNVKRRFALDNHIFSDINCENLNYLERPHKLILISSIATEYLNIRLFSHGNFITREILLPWRKRHHLTKQILFARE